jgi:hypothetical protein
LLEYFRSSAITWIKVVFDWIFKSKSHEFEYFDFETISELFGVDSFLSNIGLLEQFFRRFDRFDENEWENDASGDRNTQFIWPELDEFDDLERQTKAN